MKCLARIFAFIICSCAKDEHYHIFIQDHQVHRIPTLHGLMPPLGLQLRAIHLPTLLLPKVRSFQLLGDEKGEIHFYYHHTSR